MTATTFKVSEVKISKKPCGATNYAALFSGRLKKKVEACSQGDRPVVQGGKNNSFLEAVTLAFSQHYPLILSPDAIWLCITQGLAAHVNANAEKLRHHFVQHKGKETITIRRDDFIKGSPDNNWPAVFDQFSVAIEKYIGDKHDIIVADFSTTGAVERAVSEIVLMDTVKQYFEYEFGTMCGIPEITLEGTVDDWKSIRLRAEKLAEFDLEWWMKGLLPVLDQFVAAKGGDVERDFWQSFYKWNDDSGGPYVTGWINVLFPYLKDWTTKEYTEQNSYVNSWSERMKMFGGGPTTDSFPLGLSQVPFKWEYYSQTFDMQFVGGFAGVSHDKQTLAVRPEIGWAVVEANQPTNSPDRGK